MAGSCFGGVLLCCNGHGGMGPSCGRQLGGREVVKRRRRWERERERDGCDVIAQLTGGSLRSFTIGFLYVLLRLLRSVCFSYSTPATLPAALLPSGQPNVPVRTGQHDSLSAARCPSAFRPSPVPLSHRHAHVVVVLLSSCQIST
jgi:hypothetical protein